MLACLPAATALAQSAAPEIRPHPVVVITATRVAQDGFDLPTAIDRIDADVIAEGKLQVNLSEALNRVPGIVVQNRYNYAQDLQVSLRGFGARSTFGVRGVRLIADGIPATMPDGQGQAATFSLSSADHIEVLRGPFSSLYGNSSGGVVQIFTADGPPAPTLRGDLFIGSFATRKYGLQFGGQQQDLNYLVDTSRFSTHGYRDHSAATRDQLNAKFKLPLPAGGLTLVVNALDQPDTQDPLGLTRVQMQNDPRRNDASADRFNTRKSIRQNQIGAIYDLGRPSESGGALQARLYAGDRAVTQYLGQEGSTPLSSGGVVDLSRDYGGAGLRWTRTVEVSARKLTVTAGFDGDRMHEHRRGFVNSDGQQAGLKRDEDDVVADADGYLQAEWQAAERLSISAGARASRVKFDSSDHYIVGANPDDSGRVTYTRTTPVAGVVYQPTANSRIYANYGAGFETPTFAELAYRTGGATGLNFALLPAKSNHAEAGIKAAIGSDTRINAALFRITTRDEIVTNASSGGRSDFRNASQTQRDGIELSAQSYLPLGFEAYLAYTHLSARFTTPYTAGTPPVTIPSGARLPGVAQDVLYGELVWRSQARGFHAAIEYRATSKVYVNDANSDSAAGYGVASVRAGFAQTAGGSPNAWRFSEFVRVDNLGDRRYAGSVIVAEANGRFFEPAPRRNFLAGINAQLSF
jgi:iron complex outermembrane recepter protein